MYTFKESYKKIFLCISADWQILAQQKENAQFSKEHVRKSYPNWKTVALPVCYSSCHVDSFTINQLYFVPRTNGWSLNLETLFVEQFNVAFSQHSQNLRKLTVIMIRAMIHFSENNTEWFPIVRHVDHVSDKQGLWGKQRQVMKQPLTAFKYLFKPFRVSLRR